MRRTLITILSTGAVLATGSGVAAATSGGGSTPPALTAATTAAAGSATLSTPPPRRPALRRAAGLDDLARRLGVTRARLDAALTAIRERDQGRPFGFGPGFGHHGGVGGDGFLAAAESLDLSVTQLMRQLRTRTLTEVARARSRSVDDLKAAIRAADVEALDAAVADGHLTAAQRTEALERLDENRDDLVNGRSPFVTALARELDLDRARVATALRDSALARVDAARAAGDLTEAQADALREQIRSNEAPVLLRFGHRHGGRERGRERGRGGPGARFGWGAGPGAPVPGRIA